MEDIFKPHSLTIKELFGNADALYQIPNYQRPYSWTDPEVCILWDDLYEAFKNNENDSDVDVNYFLGSIIVVTPKSKGGYYDVVDGQQRLTTLMILFCVIRDMFPLINQQFDTQQNPTVVKHKRLIACITDDDERKRLRLSTHAQHLNDFERFIIDNTNYQQISKPNKNALRSEPKFRFINSAYLFREKLNHIGESEAGKFLNYLFNQVKLIRIECQSRDFAIKLFQVLNNRGLDLSSADLIKSYLLNNLDEQRHPQFIADWQHVEHVAKDVYSDLNELFTFYLYYLSGSNPKKSLYEELEVCFKGQDSNRIISDFKDFVTLYQDEVYEKADKVIYSFFYLRWSTHWKAILITGLHTKYPEYGRLVKTLRRFYYLYWMAGKSLTEVKQTSFSLIKWVKEGRSIEFIEGELNRKITEDKIIPQVLEALQGDLYAEPWLKPLLLLMEYEQTDNSHISFIPMDQHLHVEHILPRSFDNIPAWAHITNDVAEKYLNSGGNLTLLSGKKNIEASNNPFQEKIEVYRGKGRYNDSKTGITAFRITQRVVDDYVTEKYAGEWNEEAMQDRLEWFLQQVSDLLSISTTELILTDTAHA